MAVIDPNQVEVVPYDFRRPPWISPERRAILNGIHARMIPGLERALAPALRPPVTVAIREVVQVSFGDWLRDLRTPVAAFLAPLAAGQGGEALLLLSPDFAGRVLDRILGGVGEPGERPASLTALEQAVLTQVLSGLLAALAEGYREAVPFTPGPLRGEEIVESLAIVPRHERILLVELTVTAGELGGPIHFALPASRIAAFVRGGRGEATPVPPAVVTRERVAGFLRGAMLPVSARLSGFRLTARDGATLAVGQVFGSNQPFAGTVELHVNGRTRFVGALGSHHGRVSLRLHERTTGAPPVPRILRRTTTP